MSASPRYRWQPTTAQIAARHGLDPGDVIRFDHNTSPYPTGWVVAAVAAEAVGLNEYPGADYGPLREAAGAHTGAVPGEVAVGAGADELILLAARAWLAPGDRAVTLSPTYPLYRIATLQQRAVLAEVPAGEPPFLPDPDRLVDEAGRSDLTWLCIPNNPTGNRLPDKVIDAVLDAAAGLVVVDAAYAEFAGDRWIERVRSEPRLVVLHTLSKAFGIAGARVGYALAHPERVADLDGVRPPGSIASTSLAAAIAALRDPERMREAVDRVGTARDDLATALEKVDLAAYPSTTNFLLCRPEGRAAAVGAAAMAQRLMERGLVIRVFPEGHPLHGHVRFTARTPAEHDRLITELETILP